jgi:hypothetical protein
MQWLVQQAWSETGSPRLNAVRTAKVGRLAMDYGGIDGLQNQWITHFLPQRRRGVPSPGVG